MALNVTSAVIGSGCNTATATPSIAQWDQGQVLKIEGVDLPAAYQVEFSTEYTRNAIPRIGNADGVSIPNELLQRSAPITAYIVLHEGESDRETEYWITIHITPRTPPETITPDPEEQSVIDETIAALQDGVAAAEAAAQSVQNMGVEAETLAAGSEATVEKEVDPETEAVTLTFGIPRGNQGNPGVTPDFRIGTVETLPATSPATATITGTAAEPVLNLGIPQGQKGDPGGSSGTTDYRELENKPQINGHTLSGDQSASDLGLGTYSKPGTGIPKTDLASDVQQSLGKADSALQSAPVSSVAGKTGAVQLNAGDIEFADSETYAAGSIGAEVSQQKNAISQNEETIGDLDNAFVRSPNLYDTSENVVGVLLASNGNLYPTYTDFVTSGYIPVTPGATLRAQYDATLDGDGKRHDISDNYRFQYYTSCFYDASQVFIPGSGGNNTKLLTVPADAAYFRFTITNASAASNTNIAIIESTSSEVLPYVEPNSIWYLKEQYIPASYDDHIKEVVGLNADGIILNVPTKIYAVTGIELNVYFENITEDWTKYQWDVTCAKGKQMARGYSITPSASDIGEYSLKIKASINPDTYKEITTTLIIVSASSGSDVSIIVLGDSTTDNGHVINKIHTDFEAANTTVNTLGTRGTAPNNHEGRSGWRAYNYVTTQSSGAVENPFYNPSTSTFDASYYFANSGVSVPDWFFINLGINDVFGYVSDEELNPWIPTILGYYDTMVASLKSAAPNMKIGVCVTIPPNDSQDAFGKDYNCGQTRNRCKRNNAIWAEKFIEHFSGQEDENVYLVPIHVNLDTVYNMGLETVPVNARNTSVTHQSPTANGGVHPSESGYWQIADVYTAFLKAYAN